MRVWIITFFTWLLIASGSFLLVFGGMDYWESRRSQNEISAQWRQDQSEQPVPDEAANSFSGPVPRVAPPPLGSAVAKLTIPRLDTVLYVVEGADNPDLKRGPGHLRGTVLPGEE